ncbi:OmpH family outer membrane protein [Bacteroidota bacterium]
MDKAQAAIEKVAKANGFTYVFDLGAGGLLYFSDQSIDILPLVKKELGIE